MRGVAKGVWTTGFAFALCACAASVDGGILRVFETGATGELVVEAERATVEVRGGSDSVRVSITRRGDDADAIEEDYDIAFEQTGDRVHVQALRREDIIRGRLKLARDGRDGEDGEDGGSWGETCLWRCRGPRGIAIAIDVPDGFGAELRTTGGTVSVAGLAGPLAARTSGGSIHVADVPGAVTTRTSGGSIRHSGTSATMNAKTSGGSIELAAVEGDVYATTSGGKIDIGEAGGGVQAKTSGGSIRATLAAQPEGESSFRTSGGSVTVHLDPELALDVEARTSGGRVRVDDELAFIAEDDAHDGKPRRRVQGRLNGGGPALVAHTSGGSINLLRR